MSRASNPLDDRRVAIVGGTGALGRGLAARLAATGRHVVLGSRDASRAHEIASRIGVDGASNSDAVAAATAVILAVPFASHHQTLADLSDAWQDHQLLIDATVPLAAAVGGRPTQSLGVWAGSAAQQARGLVPDKVAVVAALHTVSAKVLSDAGHELAEDVLVCGDGRAEKERAARIIEDIDGLRCVDAGRLDMARLVENLTPLIIGLNIRHRATVGIKLTGLHQRSLR